MKRDILKEDKAPMLKFSRGFYQPKSIAQAVKEFKRAYGQKIDFVIKKDKKFIEVKIIVDSAVKEKMVDEFANYALFLNAK